MRTPQGARPSPAQTVQGLPLLGLSTFVGLYGVMNTPLSEAFDPAFADVMQNATHAAALGLTAYVVVQVRRKAANWYRQHVHFNFGITVGAAAKNESPAEEPPQQGKGRKAKKESPSPAPGHRGE